MIELKALRDHALKNPDKSYPLGSCEECLAAELTGEVLNGYAHTQSGTPIDPRFADFTRGVCGEAFNAYKTSIPDRSRLTGRQIADALDAIEAGTSPVQAAQDAWANRGVA